MNQDALTAVRDAEAELEVVAESNGPASWIAEELLESAEAAEGGV